MSKSPLRHPSMPASQHAIAAQPSFVVLPLQSKPSQFPTVLSFLVDHFSQIPPEQWVQRIQDGKVHWQNGELITAETVYRATERVYYYREVMAEQKVPFTEEILHQDAHKIIVYKPHFLPVTPGGNYVNECLVNRLRLSTGIDTIIPAHRLDKDTAGVMLMSVNPDTRHLYHQLFVDGAITKTYQALAKLPLTLIDELKQGIKTLPINWTIKNCIKPAKPSFIMQIADGESNSHSEISLIGVNGDIGLFELSPITGKTHQLRLHMLSLGMPILNDRFYPVLQPKPSTESFELPLKLLAQKLSFIDPVTKQLSHWQCPAFRL